MHMIVVLGCKNYMKYAKTLTKKRKIFNVTEVVHIVTIGVEE